MSIAEGGELTKRTLLIEGVDEVNSICLNGIFVGVVLQRSHYGRLTTLATVLTSKLATNVTSWVIVNTF